MLSVTSTPVELIDDNTAQQYYNEFDTLEGAERDSRAEALRLWADQKDADRKREQFDTLNKIYSDFDGYVNDAGLQDFDEESRYRTANRQFIASQFDDTVENQQTIYPSFRDKWTESVAGKKGLSEKETFDLIKQGIDARNEVSQAANEIPGDIALALFDSLDGGDPVDVPKLIDTWKTKNAESIKKLPKGWETPLLEAAQKYHTETDTMLRDYAEPLKQVYDHFAAVTGRDTERAGESNPKNQEELDSLVDTLASMPKPVRERAYASVVLGAKKAGQDPKTFMDQWGESWSRTLNMVRTGALTAQEMAAESEARQLEDKASPPDYYISKSTGEKIPLANRAFHDEADLRKVTPEEIAADAAKARQKVKRFEVVRELQSVADNQFDPIEKINKGGFLGFMEAMAYGTPQSLAYTGTALIPVVGPYLAGTAIFADEYNQLREQGMSVDQAVQVGSVSAGIQAGLERTGAELIFGKLPVFEKLMRRIANPARVGKAGSAGIRFFSAALGENITEGAQDLTTPLVQDVAEALGADVPDVQWQSILEKWSGSRLDVLAATIPTILLGTGVATFGDNKRFAQFEERQDIYRSMGMDDATIKEIEDGKDISEKQQKFQTAFSKLTPENVKAGVAYMEEKIASAQGQQQDPNTPTLTRATLADGSQKFVIRDPNGEVRYSTSEEQTAQIVFRELLRNQITGTTRGIVEALSFFNQVNEAANRGDDIQKFILENTPRNLLDEYEANPTDQNLDNLFKTVATIGQDISEPAELANFPVLASNQGALAEGIFKSVIRIYEGATGDKVVRDVAQDNLKRAIAEQRITMDWVRENLNQIIPQIDSERITQKLRTETDTDVIESFSDVALAYMRGNVRDEQIPAGFRGFLRRMAIVVKDIFRRAYRLKRLVAEGKVDTNFEALLAESVGLNQQTLLDTTRDRVSNEVLTDTNYSIGSKPYPMEDKGKWYANEDFAQRGGRIVTMSPDQFLSQVRPLEVDEASRDNIDDLKNMMQSGRKLDPLAIYADGKEDGRHRAIAAKELGITSIPVIDFRQPVSADTGATNYSIGFAPNGNPSNLKPEEQALARSPEFKSRFGDWEALEYQTRIEQFILDALDGKKDQEEIPLRKVTAQEVNEVMRQGGPNISGMEHVLDAAHIRHALKSHSSPDEGAKQSGQRPLTQNDLMRIPEIINSYDSLRVKKAGTNRTSIIYGKSYQDGTINYIERVFETSKRNKPRLITKTVWAVTEAGVKSNSTRVYTPDRDPTLPLANGRVNPESVSVKTDENGEPLASEIARFRQETGTSSYSIASQSEIDRVNRALGGMNRGPDERLKVYERAKAKFSTLLQNNQQALDNLRAGTVSFRRTQLLQALGELDAILSIFPPDIRGRVGGYTRLASIAPHDVFKDGEKVSEVSGMNGAIISAWMREGQNIGEAGKQTELPPGYTAKENLGTARSDKAIADFFKKRIEMIDRELEKTLRREYDEAFRKLLDRTKPKKAAPGEKPKGIGGDIQDLFAVVRDSVDMSATQVAAHIAGLDAMIASGELTAEQEARAQVEAALVSLTGDWKNADADRRRTALMEASRIWNGAYATHTQKLIRQREEREIARAEAIVATGKAGELAGRKSKAISDSGLKGSWKDYILNLLNFDQVVGVLFGENSEISNTIIDKQRRAENAKEDGSQAKMQELEDFFTGLAGGKVLDGERLRYRLTQPSMTVDGIEMSELEALSAVMMWAQEDGRRHMEGEMDETGKPSGKWHYNQAFVDEILANLSTEAMALRDWLGQRYASEYANINAVYSELNGVNLPQIRNYSPVTVQPVNAPTGQVLDPVSGSAMSGASTSPGALRTRGTAIAEPRFQDVLQTYISHTLQMEHWKAFAPMIAEANGILRNRDVQNSVEEKGGAEARKMLNAWLDYFAQGGTRDAGAHLALNQGLNNVLGRASQVALVGRASTLLIQSTQLGAALAEMPVKAYLKRMGKLLTGQLGWADAINSDYIQRRMKQMPPVVQLAMQGLKGAKPTAIQQAGKQLGMLLSGADGLFTAGTYAITYDYHLTKAKELGLAGQEAEDYARNTAERVTDRIAQPTRAGARSLYENTSTNPLARAGWAFASEARKNLALVAYSFAQRDTATKMRTLAYVVALNAIGSAILRSIWRDILDDEDEELFDDKYWSPKRIAMAIATEPFYGFPVLGSVVQEAVYKSFGEYKPAESLFSVDRAVGPIKRLPDHLSGDTDMREVMRDIDMVISSLGIMHPNIAATASITHLAKDLFNLGDSAVDAVTED